MVLTELEAACAAAPLLVLEDADADAAVIPW